MECQTPVSDYERIGEDRRQRKIPHLEYLIFGGERSSIRRIEDASRLILVDRYGYSPNISPVGNKMKIDINDERYFCSKIEVEVTISSIRYIQSNNKCQKLFSYVIDCDHRNICGVVEWSNGQKSMVWCKCVHPELNGYDKLKN